MFWKFFDPGFLKRCKGELVKSFVKLFSSPSFGIETELCLEAVTLISLP